MIELKHNKSRFWNCGIPFISILLVSFIAPSTFSHSLTHTIENHDASVVETHIDHPSCNQCETNGHDCCFEVHQVRITTQKTSSQKKIPFSQSLWFPKPSRKAFLGQGMHRLAAADFIPPLPPQSQFRGTVLII